MSIYGINMVKLIIETEHKQKVTIEAEVETGNEYVQDLFIPAMLALQFHPDTVDEVFGKSN